MNRANTSSTFPFQALVGQEVTQVSLGLGQVQLHFYQSPSDPSGKWTPGARIDVEAGFEVQMPGQLATRILPAGFKPESGVLAYLLGEQVLRVQPAPRSEVQLWFSGGASVRLLTDAQGFESYHLHFSGESITFTQDGEA